MCNYPVSNIQYPLFNDGGANWILAVGYLHISTFNMSAKSKPAEKEMMVNLVMTFLA